MDSQLEAHVRIFENPYIIIRIDFFSKTLKGHFYVLLGYQSSVKEKRLETMILEEWEELGRPACSTIMLNLAQIVYFNIAKEMIAYEVWQKLCDMYEKQSTASQIYWLKKVVDLNTKEQIVMSTCLNEFNTIFSQLTM